MEEGGRETRREGCGGQAQTEEEGPTCHQHISTVLRVKSLFCLCNQPVKDQGGSRTTDATAVGSGLRRHITGQTTFKAQLCAVPTWAVAAMPWQAIIHEGYEVGAGNNPSSLLLTLFTGTLVTCQSCDPGGDRSQEARERTQIHSSWPGSHAY